MTILTSLTLSLLLLLTPSHSLAASPQQIYLTHAISAANTLLTTSYNPSTGLFADSPDDAANPTPGWWTSANALTTLGNLAALDPSSLQRTAEATFANTFARAPYAAAVAAKYNVRPGTFLDDFYDDEGWWALAWMKAWDVTGNATYLDEAKTIFADIDAAGNGRCGGRPWTRVGVEGNQVNSVTNELYLALAAGLANRVADDSDGKAFYAGRARYQADWFYASGLLGSGGNGLIVDALDLSTCRPNASSTVWTYNQGVILSGFVEMHTLTSDHKYLDTARTIARGAVEHMVSSDGVLTEWGYPDVQAGTEQFKGVFVRGVMDLQKVASEEGWVGFLTRNADMLWARGRDGEGRIGVNWQGPVRGVGAVSQGAGVDCLVAAAAVAA